MRNTALSRRLCRSVCSCALASNGRSFQYLGIEKREIFPSDRQARHWFSRTSSDLSGQALVHVDLDSWQRGTCATDAGDKGFLTPRSAGASFGSEPPPLWSVRHLAAGVRVEVVLSGVGEKRERGMRALVSDGINVLRSASKIGQPSDSLCRGGLACKPCIKRGEVSFLMRGPYV